MDTWIGLHHVEASGERNRALYVLKSRGMSHSNQIREYRLDGNGINLIDAYIGAAGVLIGTAREMQEARERDETMQRRDEAERRRREIEIRRAATERQIEEMRAALEVEEIEFARLATASESREQQLAQDRAAMLARRSAAE